MSELAANESHKLRLDGLPDLPQIATLRELAARLWRDERVIAVWLGGSLASGAGDKYSDLDVRVAVARDDLSAWDKPDFAALFGAEPLARFLIHLGSAAFLHHLVIANGDILDLEFRAADIAPADEPSLVLGCRDEEFATRLAAANHEPEPDDVPATPEAVSELLETFWVNNHKHRKVLYRNLDLMFPAAVHANWQLLMRLWYIAATGNEVRSYHFVGIHGLTELVRAVEASFGHEPLDICGMPCRTREEICAIIERAQDVVAQLGRELAARYGCEYPLALEEVARAGWRAFRTEQPAQ
jgi:predicted nucleotidyltransferase